MIGNRQVVVDCLRHAHESLRFIVCSRIIGQHLNRIHGIIAACIEEALYIMFLHDLKYFLINIFMTLNLRHLKTAGAKECGRRSLEQFNACLIIQIVTKINHLVIQKSLDTMHHTINFLHTQFLCGCINTCHGRINNGCRAARLTNNNISFHFSCLSFDYFLIYCRFIRCPQDINTIIPNIRRQNKSLCDRVLE